MVAFLDTLDGVWEYWASVSRAWRLSWQMELSKSSRPSRLVRMGNIPSIMPRCRISNGSCYFFDIKVERRFILSDGREFSLCMLEQIDGQEFFSEAMRTSIVINIYGDCHNFRLHCYLLIMFFDSFDGAPADFVQPLRHDAPMCML